ncbi:UNVERIFIED_CONTAM: hypothetical protein FKN15_054248 [Acipenser sinensis]
MKASTSAAEGLAIQSPLLWELNTRGVRTGCHFTGKASRPTGRRAGCADSAGREKERTSGERKKKNGTRTEKPGENGETFGQTPSTV